MLSTQKKYALKELYSLMFPWWRIGQLKKLSILSLKLWNTRWLFRDQFQLENVKMVSCIHSFIQQVLIQCLLFRNWTRCLRFNSIYFVKQSFIFSRSSPFRWNDYKILKVYIYVCVCTLMCACVYYIYIS